MYPEIAMTGVSKFGQARQSMAKHRDTGPSVRNVGIPLSCCPAERVRDPAYPDPRNPNKTTRDSPVRQMTPLP